jgi:hypothetical protein
MKHPVTPTARGAVNTPAIASVVDRVIAAIEIRGDKNRKERAMSNRTRVARAALVLSIMMSPLATHAAVNVDVTIAPPAPVVEAVPAPRVGYVWAPGFWEWRGGQHVWVAGRWIPARHGYHYVAAHWVPYGPQWRFVPARWVR